MQDERLAYETQGKKSKAHQLKWSSGSHLTSVSTEHPPSRRLPFLHPTLLCQLCYPCHFNSHKNSMQEFLFFKQMKQGYITCTKPRNFEVAKSWLKLFRPASQSSEISFPCAAVPSKEALLSVPTPQNILFFSNYYVFRGKKICTLKVLVKNTVNLKSLTWERRQLMWIAIWSIYDFTFKWPFSEALCSCLCCLNIGNYPRHGFSTLALLTFWTG